MSKPGSRAEEVDEARRRAGMERLFGRPSDWAADWSMFTNEFLDRLSVPLGFNPAAMIPRTLQSAVLPGVEIVEENNELTVSIDMPGFDKQDISVRVLDNVLHVSANRKKVAEVGTVYWSSKPLKYSKMIWLPAAVEPGAKAKAKYDNGMLEVRIPLSRTGTIPVE